MKNKELAILKEELEKGVIETQGKKAVKRTNGIRGISCICQQLTIFANARFICTHFYIYRKKNVTKQINYIDWR